MEIQYWPTENMRRARKDMRGGRGLVAMCTCHLFHPHEDTKHEIQNKFLMQNTKYKILNIR